MVPGRRDSGYQGSEARRSSVWVRMTIVTECISVAFWVPGAIQVCGIYTPVNKINLFFFFPLMAHLVRVGHWRVLGESGQ